MSVCQKNRFIRFVGDYANALVLLSVEGSEQLSAPYRYNVVFQSTMKPTETSCLLGKDLSCEIGSGQKVRYVQGVVTDIEEETDDKGLSLWKAVLQPRLALLKLSRNLAVWQNITVPDLVCQLLRDNNIKDIDLRLHGQYALHDYCIQYRESDFDFISRLLEQEGIYYFFCQEEKQQMLVLADHPSCHKAAITPDLAYLPEAGKGDGSGVSGWSLSSALSASSVTLKSFNIEQAKAIHGESQSDKTNYYAEGIHFVDSHEVSSQNGLESQARLKMEQLAARTRTANADIEAWWLSCGESFNLTSHPSSDGTWVVASLALRAVNNLHDNMSEHFCRASVFPGDNT